jgi:diacylglycerol kinase
MKNKKFSIRSRLQSFVYAFNGLKIMLRGEHNSRIHLLAAIIVIIAAWMVNVSSTEWLLLIVVIGSVFVAELFNSALEYLADQVSSEKNAGIKRAKDLAAAAVLVSALTALVVGCIILLPKIARMI